MVEAREHSSD